MKKITVIALLILFNQNIFAQLQNSEYEIKAGNFHPFTPYGICIIADDKTGLVIDPDYPDKYGQTRYGKSDPAGAEPAMTAPDYSYSEVTLEYNGAKVHYSWGRYGSNAVIAALESDKPVELKFKITPGWPRFHLSYFDYSEGIAAWGMAPDGSYIPFRIAGYPVPEVTDIRRNQETAWLTFKIDPGKPTVFAAGVGELPSLGIISEALKKAGGKYQAGKITAEGEWGDFPGAIMQNLNNAKLYSSDNKRIVHIVGRGWWITRKDNPDLFPYFVWDGFFASAMSSLGDVEGARNTVRGVLSYTTPSGFVPSYSHWSAEIGYTTLDRSMPPVGSMCVWKMHQRFPDKAFLEEVYPKLVSWHNWWLKARDGNNDGLLEWGSELKSLWFANLETGWDDNVHYSGCKMEGTTMNADAVDLNSLWSLDTEYLAKIADAIGKTDDAEHFRTQQKEINELINKYLWNEKLGIYCSRFWKVPDYVENKQLDDQKIFDQRFKSTFYLGSNFTRELFSRVDTSINFKWTQKSPVMVPKDSAWCVRFTGRFSVPANGTYRLLVETENFVRIILDDKIVIDGWKESETPEKFCDVTLRKAEEHTLKIEYTQQGYGSDLKFGVYTLRKSNPDDAFLTRITAMNFYPLMCGAPDKAKAEKTLNWLYRKDKFWGSWIVPTVSYDDPVYQMQGYWRGYVWGPSNYLIYQGVKRYASPEQKAEYIRKSVNLFMRNWENGKLCCENYNSINGTCGDDPHYTWGALLAFLGVEALTDINENFEPVPPQEPLFMENITIHNIPFGGKLYTIENKDKKVKIMLQK